MNPALNITLEDPRTFRVERTDNVHSVLWNKICAEWGTIGGDPNFSILTPVEVFLSNMEWLKDSCTQFTTGIDWGQTAKDLVVERLNEQKSVLNIMSGVNALTEEEVEGRLENGRFIRDLRKFQKRDLGWLLALPNGANFSVPGAGKTTVTYALYEAERLAGKVAQLLVVAPLSAFDAWTVEADDCFDEPPQVFRFDGTEIPETAEVCLINYQRLPDSYDIIAKWLQSKPTQMVLDEAHRMKKGWGGAWGRNSLYLAHVATRRDILTGTPAPQSVKDVVALVDFVWPNQSKRILPPAVFASRPPKNIAAQVGDLIAPLFVRTTKAELDLPAPLLKIIEVPLDGHQRAIYQALKNQYAGDIQISRIDRAQFARMGRIVMFLLEAATNPALLPFGGKPDPTNMRPIFPMIGTTENTTLTELLQNYPQHEVTPKLQKLHEIVQENATLGRKTLIWTNFVANILMLKGTMNALNPACIFGAVPSEVAKPNADVTREAELDRFRNDPDCLVLIANPAAMSEGVSLHKCCHDAVYLDRTFNAGHYLQSLDRIHRLGMPDTETRISFLVTKETIDVAVNDRVRGKAEQLGIILEDATISKMALPDDGDTETFIDTGGDLEALFTHLRGNDMNGGSDGG